ncbi:MAG: nucleotide exchange factor GrpE [Phycisphaerales bacterium]
MNEHDPTNGQPEHGEGPSPGDCDPQIAELMEQVQRLQAERDDLNQKYLRTAADSQNAQRRALREQEEAKRQGMTSVIANVLTVLDHFDLALAQDPAKVTAQQIISGVRVIRDELSRILQSFGVQEVNPRPGEEFDPHRHQAVMQRQSESVPPGRIVQTLQPGYALGERIIRPAKVAIRPSQPHDAPPAAWDGD